MPLLTNPRRERFAQHVAEAGNGSAAYRMTYGVHGASAEVGASRLLRNDKVKRRVRELQGEAARAAVMTLEEQRLLLAAVARGEHKGAKISDRLRAIEIDAKLAGHANGKEDKPRASIVPEIIIREEGDPGWERHPTPKAPYHLVDGEEPQPVVFNVPAHWGNRRSGEALSPDTMPPIIINRPPTSGRRASREHK